MKKIVYSERWQIKTFSSPRHESEQQEQDAGVEWDNSDGKKVL